MDNPKQAYEKILKELETANRRIEELQVFEVLTEEANDGIVVVQEGIIKYVNQKLADITGFVVSEAIGMPFINFIHPTEEQFLTQRYNKRMPGINIPSIFKTILKHKNGTFIKVEMSTKIILYYGNPADFIIIRDLTEREKTEERLKSSLAFIDSAPDSFYLLDSDLKLIDVNPSGILEYPDNTQKKDIIGMHMTELVPGIEKTERFQKYTEVLKTGIPTFINEYPIFDRRGTQYFSSRCFKVKDGIGIISTEITNLKKIEEEKKRVQEQFKRIKREEELYHSMQSHFIKNDLQQLIFLLESTLFQSYSNHQKEENIHKAIEICRHVSKTIDIVNKIFSVLQSKFETRKSKKSLLEMIEDALSSIRIRLILEKENLDIMIQLDDYFKDLLHEIFTFIGSSDNYEIQITQGKKMDENAFYVIEITDTITDPLPENVCDCIGTGIKEEKWETLGHNIGLTLASVICQYYGGKLTIKPQREKGNSYQIYLPSTLIIT